MTRVLLLRLDPSTVDFSDPALPPGLDADRIHAGIQAAMAQMLARGWTAHHRYITPDIPSAVAAMREELARADYDCVVIGGGVRAPPKNVRLLEALINAVRIGAPGAAIAFNTTPLDTAEAVERVLT